MKKTLHDKLSDLVGEAVAKKFEEHTNLNTCGGVVRQRIIFVPYNFIGPEDAAKLEALGNVVIEARMPEGSIHVLRIA